MWVQKTENPHFIETDELWSTYNDTFGKPSGKVTWPPNFVSQSSKTAKIWRWGKNRKTPTFEKKAIFLLKKYVWPYRGKHLRPKRLFSREKIGGGADPPPKKFLKIRFFERPLKKRIFAKKIFSGWEPTLTPKFRDPINFRLFVDIWTLYENFALIGKDKLELQASEILTQCNGWPNGLEKFFTKNRPKNSFGL